jgi:uncharacterized protein with HEPN domain
MSSRDWKFRIYDILISISKIEHYLQDLRLNDFKKNELVVDAVIRNFEIIGEASNKIPLRIRKKYTDIPWLEMSDMRNLLIHEYFGVDEKIVWHTAKKYLPKLKNQLEELLENESL